MIDDVGIFRTTIGVAAVGDPSTRRDVTDVMVDSGSEYTWLPTDLLAAIGIVPVRIDRFTGDADMLTPEGWVPMESEDGGDTTGDHSS